MDHKHNESIGCTVCECENHCKDDNFCKLDKIEVVKHEPEASNIRCTDCSNFVK